MLTKNSRAKKIMHDVVREELNETCLRVIAKTRSLKEKLTNGGGEALIKALTE